MTSSSNVDIKYDITPYDGKPGKPFDDFDDRLLNIASPMSVYMCVLVYVCVSVCGVRTRSVPVWGPVWEERGTCVSLVLRSGERVRRC